MLSLLLSDGSGIGGNGWTGKRTDGWTDSRKTRDDKLERSALQRDRHTTAL